MLGVFLDGCFVDDVAGSLVDDERLVVFEIVEEGQSRGRLPVAVYLRSTPCTATVRDAAGLRRCCGEEPYSDPRSVRFAFEQF